MSDLYVLPSSEELVIAILLNHPAGVAEWGTNVGTTLPATPPLPFVRVQRGGGATAGGPYWLDSPTIDIHAYGRSQMEAEHACRIAHAILHAARNVTVPDVGVLTGVSDVQGVVRLPDDDVGLERYLFSVDLTTHPTP